jgi:transcriptional regulator with XRE-family HTH domain
VKTPPPETFGQRVARLRVAAGLTQEQLAAKAELPAGSLRNYEYDHRRPRADAALRLARALGVTVEELLVLPSSKPARAQAQDAPGLRGLKRAWARAKGDERRQFLEFVAEEGAGQNADAGTADVAKVNRVAKGNQSEPKSEGGLRSLRDDPAKQNKKPRK